MTYLVSRARARPNRAVFTSILRLAFAAATVGCAGEARTPAVRQKPIDSRLVNEHGIRVGDSIVLAAITCSDGIDRNVTPRGSVELITFATPGDCTECQTHMMGLEMLARAGKLPSREFVLTRISGEEPSRTMATLSDGSVRPVCIDTSGRTWDMLQLQHTPVTAVLRNGRIVYLHDEPLISEEQQRLLASDLSDLGLHLAPNTTHAVSARTSQ